MSATERRVVVTLLKPAAAPVVGAVVGLYLAFVLARLAAFGWDPSAFVVAGDRVTDAAEAPPGLGVNQGTDGYDGQAYYRLSRSPLTHEVRDHGITFTRPAYWQARIGYPVTVWLLAAGGTAPLVPGAMLVVNLAAMLAVIALAVILAREPGASLWLAVTPALWAGYLIGVAEDLTEPLAGALLLAALLALRRERWLAALTALTVAALTRETSLVVPMAVVGVALAPALRRLPGSGKDGGSPVPPWWVGAVPVGAYFLWRTWVRSRWEGVVPDPPGDNILTWPFLGLARYLGNALRNDGADPSAHLTNGLLLALTLAAIGLVVSGLVTGMRAGDAGLAHERLALAAYLVLLACLPVWDRGQAYLRWCCEPVLLGWLVMLRPRSPRPATLAVVVGVLWLAAAVTTYPYPGPEHWTPAAGTLEHVAPTDHPYPEGRSTTWRL